MSRRLALLALVAFLAPAARAEDPELRIRIFRLDALVMGASDHVPEDVGVTSPRRQNDEEHPLFGAEAEEALRPYGNLDEVIELVKSRVEPSYWSATEGAEIKYLGSSSFVARAEPRVLDAIGTFLAELEAATFGGVTVEVRTAPAAGEGTPDARAAAADGPSVVLTALPGQLAAAFAGRQRAFVQGYTSLVAQSSSTSDPIVSVANLGLGVAFRATAAAEDRIVLDLNVQVAEMAELRAKKMGDFAIDLPIWRNVVARSVVVLRPGRWTEVQADGEAGVVLVRATAARPPASGARAVVDLPLVASAETGRVADDVLDVTDLNVQPRERMGELVHLAPSYFTPPEPPELREPSPIVPIEALVELIKESGASGRAWNDDAATIEARNGKLLLRNRREVLAAARETVRRLREDRLRTVDVEATVVSVPEAVARRMTETGPGGPVLDGPRRAALEEARSSGAATVLAQVHVPSLDSRRNTVTSGRRIEYVQSFDSRIAEKSAAASPVLHSVLSGTVVDLQPALTSTGDAVHVAVRFTRSDVKTPIRSVATPHGALDAPEMDVTRLRSDLRIPIDATAVVGAGSDGERAVVLLLTPRIRPD